MKSVKIKIRPDMNFDLLSKKTQKSVRSVTTGWTRAISTYGICSSETFFREWKEQVLGVVLQVRKEVASPRHPSVANSSIMRPRLLTEPPR
jgi:hypothetical protein